MGISGSHTPIFAIVPYVYSLSCSITCNNIATITLPISSVCRAFIFAFYDKSIGSMSSNQDKVYEPDLNQKHQDCLQYTATAHWSSRMPRAVLLWVGAHRWPWEGAKELLMRPAGILSLFSFSVTSLKDRFIISLYSKGNAEGLRMNAEFRNPCVPVTHPHKMGFTHTHTHRDDSCITRDWRWLITASFIRVT